MMINYTITVDVIIATSLCTTNPGGPVVILEGTSLLLSCPPPCIRDPHTGGIGLYERENILATLVQYNRIL